MGRPESWGREIFFESVVFGWLDERSESSNFLLMRQNDPFGEPFSELYFEGFNDITFW